MFQDDLSKVSDIVEREKNAPKDSAMLPMPNPSSYISSSSDLASPLYQEKGGVSTTRVSLHWFKVEGLRKGESLISGKP